MHCQTELSEVAYLRYFEDAARLDLDDLIRRKEELFEHRIKIDLEEEHRRGYDVRLISFNRRISSYRVCLGPFQLKMIVLHYTHAAPTASSQNLGSGGQGTVYQESFCKQTFAVKTVSLSQDIREVNRQLLDVIREVAICKVCSFLGIGPAVETRVFFDLICHRNRVSFHMEKCEQLTDSDYNTPKLEDDLKKCLSLLHRFHIVHKDIKPANILWSASRKQYVLADFGVAQFVKETVGEQSFTFCEGTTRFMSPAMKRLIDEKSGRIDLYLNDFFAYQKSLERESLHKMDCRRVNLNQNGGNSSDYLPSQTTPSSNDEISSKDSEMGKMGFCGFPKQDEHGNLDVGPGRYEFYRSMYALTCLEDCSFNLRNGWEHMTLVQQRYLLQAVKESFSAKKIWEFLHQFSSVEVKHKSEEIKEHIKEIVARLLTNQRNLLKLESLTPGTLQICFRCLGVSQALMNLKRKLDDGQPISHKEVAIGQLRHFMSSVPVISISLNSWLQSFQKFHKDLEMSEGCLDTLMKKLYEQINLTNNDRLALDLLAMAIQKTISKADKSFLCKLHLASLARGGELIVEEFPKSLDDIDSSRGFLLLQLSLDSNLNSPVRQQRLLSYYIQKYEKGVINPILQAKALYMRARIARRVFAHQQKAQADIKAALSLLVAVKDSDPDLYLTLLLQKVKMGSDLHSKEVMPVFYEINTVVSYFPFANISFLLVEGLQNESTSMSPLLNIADSQTQDLIGALTQIKIPLLLRLVLGTPFEDISNNAYDTEVCQIYNFRIESLLFQKNFMLQCYNLLFSEAFQAKDYTQAEAYCKEIKARLEGLHFYHDYVMMSRLNAYAAYCQLKQNNLGSAKKLALAALAALQFDRLSTKKPTIESLSILLLLGSICSQSKENEATCFYLRKAARLSRSCRGLDFTDKIRINIMYADSLYQKREFTPCIAVSKRGILLNRRNADRQVIRMCNGMIAKCFREMGNKEKEDLYGRRAKSES